MRKEIKALLKSFAYYLTNIENIPLLETLNKFQDVPEKSRLQCAVRYNKGQTEYFTGCANSLPLTEDCRKCPFWSEEIWTKRHESLKTK